MCGNLFELVFLCIEYGKLLPWPVWFMEGRAPLLDIPLMPPMPLMPPTEPYWMLPAWEPTMLMPALLALALLMPMDELPGPLFGLL